MPTRRHLLPWLAVSIMASVGCERSTSPAPRPGLTAARLVSPNADDGAAFIELTGDVRSVTAPAGTAVYSAQVRAGVLRVLLVREVPGPIEFSLELADPSRTPIARVLDVADGQDQPRSTVNGYRVQF